MKNLKKIIVIAVIIWFSLPFGEGWGGAVFSQIGINQPSPDPSALLDLTSTNMGLLIPRMTLDQRNLINVTTGTGVLIYQTDDTPGFYYYNGTVWQRLIIDGNTGWNNTYGFITSPNDADADPTNEIQNLFLNIADAGGTTKFSAGSSSDKLRFAGTGLASVSFDDATKRVTINATGDGTGTDTQDLSYDPATDVITLTNGGSIDISEVDTDTWQPNTQAQEGYVLAGGTNYNKVWKTDASGVPAWRDDAGAGTCSHYIGEDYGSNGKIFMLDYSGCHGLISATTDQSSPTVDWNDVNFPLIGTLKWMMTGARNTTVIVAALPGAEQGIAAKLCQDLVLDGYDNWFLPAKDELYEMYLIKDVIGNFSANLYWSSSEVDLEKAWCHHFGTGVQTSNINKNPSGGARVRCVRNF